MTIFMVVLNLAILAVLIDFLVSAALISPALRGTNWETTWRAVAAAIILVAPAILLVHQVQRASIRGTAVRLSRTQFPDLYASVADFAATLGSGPPRPRISLTATGRSTRSPCMPVRSPSHCRPSGPRSGRRVTRSPAVDAGLS